jgi:hypothetical protein
MDRLVSQYGLDKKELQNLWSGKAKGKSTTKKSPPTVSSVNTEDVSEDRLLKCNKAELSALCKAQGVKCTGKKAVLIARLLGTDEEEAKNAKPIRASSKKSKSKSAASTKVVKKLTAQVPVIPIRRNQFNNHEHPETGLVFDKKTQNVIGKQNDDGSVDDLTAHDIELCKKFKFSYAVPENLDHQASLAEVQVDELDGSDESDDDVVIEEDDEEEIEMVLGDEDDEEEEFSEEEYYEEEEDDE